MKIILLIFLFLIIAIADAKVSVQLQWFDQFQFAGYYTAKEKGFYKEAGLDVEIKKYKNGLDITKEVVSGKTTFGIGGTSLLMDASNKNDIILMSAVFQSSPLVLITKKSTNINIIEDFKNRKAMLSGTKSSAGIFAMLSSQGITRGDMKILKNKDKLQQLIDGKVDIISAYISNEAYTLKEKNIAINVFNPRDFGFDFYGDILFTSQKEYLENPQIVIDFNKASLKGWEYAFSHIGETVKLILKKYNSQNKTDAELFFEALKLKELAYRNTDKLGSIDSKKIRQIYDIYKIMGHIKKPLEIDKVILNPDETKLYLNNKERMWIKKHPVIKYSEINWKPMSIIRNGKMKGIFGDFLDLVSKKTGLKFRYVPSDSWDDVIKKFKEHKIDLIPSNPQNLNLGPVTKVYKTYPMVIVTGDKYKYVSSLEDLNGKSIAVPKFYTSYNYLRKKYSDIKLITTKNIPQALTLVEEGKADAFVGHIATSIYNISALHLTNLKIAGTTKFEFKHSYLVQKEDTELLSILNKALDSITAEEKEKIYSKWSNSNKREVNYKLIVRILIFVFIIFLFLLYRNRQLKKYNLKTNKLKERLELALMGNNDGVWDKNIEANILYLSPRWKEIIGYKDNEIKNEPDTWRKRVHPDDLERALKDIQNHLDGKTEFYENIHRLKHKDGHWVWVHDRGKKILNKDGKVIRMIGTHTDITKEKEMQLKFKHQQQIIEQIHDCVILIDQDGYIVSWNRGAEVLLEYSRQEIAGRHISILYGDKNRYIISRFVKTLQKKEKLDIELELIKKSKKKIFTESSISLFRDENGKTIGIIGYIKDISRRKKAEIELKKQEKVLWYQANHDSLTKLPNRVLFGDRLERSIEKANRHNRRFALFFLDLDRFKQINDSLGHEVGDKVLKKISIIIKSLLREEDTLARLGGDEFIIITGCWIKSKHIKSLANKIIDALKEPVLVDDYKLYVSVSIGISLFPNDSKSAHNLLKFADSAMYKAKEEGRNNYQFYSQEMTELAFERVALETDLRFAIKNEEFTVFYQPQIDAIGEKIIGMEALVRWQNPTKGLISPAKFLPLAEETGMIMEIDQLVMKQAMKQVGEWRDRGLEPGVLALNLSMEHLNNQKFIKSTQDSMFLYNLDAKYLEFEVTEGKVMKKPEEMILKLKKLNDMGIKIAIDDFGTGYSSLSYLKKLPIDILKIDQSFVRHIPDSEDDSSIVKAIIALAKSLNLELIAEGVETAEQKDFLIANGCRNIQGYYYSKPLDSAEMEKLLLGYIED